MIYLIIIAIVLVGFTIFRKDQKKWKTPTNVFPESWKEILLSKVPFYAQLSAEERAQFNFQVQEFLLNCRITGIQTTVTDEDRLLVAAGAVIPIFAFPDWKYYNLQEVLLYPEAFNDSFETEGDDRRILGMVGTGYMDGKMILSQRSLHQGFENETDKKNTAIHEFIHLIDKMDGSVDGLPQVLVEKQYTLPWLDLIQKKMKEIAQDQSDINPYGGTSQIEFLTVAGEYFFERPKLLKQKHPELYEQLSSMFKQDLANRKKQGTSQRISRNDPCPCGSGEKFKRCCGR